jgi:ribosomal protein S18 acetylase RimI-like enzyme
MRFDFLSREMFPDIHKTFIAAFSDYTVDMSYMTREHLLNRAIKNGIDWGLSVGAFDEGRLVGFTLLGVDDWEGETAAFDIATGITEPFRGMGLAKAMFNHALPELDARGVRRVLLEVLQDNHAAVTAYRKSGFAVVREFDCFELQPDSMVQDDAADTEIEIREVSRDRLSAYSDSLGWRPSWENTFSSIRRIPDEVTPLEAWLEGEGVGLLVYYPAFDWIMAVVVKPTHRRRGVATALLGQVMGLKRSRRTTVKVVNVLSTDEATVALLRRLHFDCYIRQFEMQLRIQRRE